MIYVASSWRNHIQPGVVSILRENGHEVYDFRNPKEGDDGFHWTDVMPSFDIENQVCQPEEYLQALRHERSEKGFYSDFNAMEACDTCVLVLPCGKSAHLELGWFVGKGRNTAILLDRPCQPELMYKMVDLVTPRYQDILEWLQR